VRVIQFDREKWDTRYRDAASPGDPARVLTEFAHLLPTTGRALDLACGLGANALFLAARGLEVHAWDLSSVAIERLAHGARARGLTVRAEVRDVVAAPPDPGLFDVIVVAHFLERSLAPAIADALRPGGLLYYQTWTRTRVDETGPRNDAYRLEDGELLRLFTGWPEETPGAAGAGSSGRAPFPRLRVLAYREEGRVGDLTRGFRNEAMLVAHRV